MHTGEGCTNQVHSWEPLTWRLITGSCSVDTAYGLSSLGGWEYNTHGLDEDAYYTMQPLYMPPSTHALIARWSN
jgi:hypothetical protein